jgi:tRNA-2-methylthio-N6-dimethylallyladenosine synthase
MPEPSKKYFIKTFGCQMNIADSDRFARILDELGFTRSDSPSESDLVVVNTCVVRAKAEDKAISYIGEIERIRKSGSNVRVILAGCLAPLADENEIKRRFPVILFLINPANVDTFRDLILEHCKPVPDCEKISEDVIQQDSGKSSFHAFVNIMRGCEQHCTYCIVPKARGNNASRKYEDIRDEIKWRIDNGAKAITLLGQSILDYGKDWQEGKPISSIKGDDLFRDLLDRISIEFPDIWIKFLTSHSKDLSFETIDLIASRDNISKFIHLPIQSGDDGILKKMNRGHNRDDYLKLVEYINKKIPDVRLSSDIIVGFPGEDLDAFEQSLDLLRRVRFFKVFTFLYSTRPSTAAARMKDDLPIKEKRVRLNRLIDLQNLITLERHKELVGEKLIIMVEGPALKSEEMLMGRSLGEDIVIFNSVDFVSTGDFVRVKIIEERQRTLIGEFLDKA